MDLNISEMARRHYGFGRWEAPYWFIGPEQGQAHEEGSDLNPRARAWLQLGGGELCDCREYHALIAELRWHREQPRLQPTWRPLMLLLMSHLQRPTDNDSLRNYQRDSWGIAGGDTCVIELSGLPAHNLTVERDRRSFREERIARIQRRLSQHNPRLVVMYGQQDWRAIAGQEFPRNGTLRQGATTLVVTPHPTSHGPTNAFWKALGETLRES
jgi:hypothetical protein